METTRPRFLKPFIISFLIFLLLPLVIQVSQASPDVETKSPTETWRISDRLLKWLTPSFAFSSNNLYAYTSFSMATQGYKGYGFSFDAGTIITKVEAGIEGYKDSGGVGHYVSWDGGDNWEFIYSSLPFVEELIWTDVTELTDWTAPKLSDTNLRTKIKYQTGAGCYGLDAEVGLWDGGLKKVRDVEIGDILTGWNETNFAPATVLNFTIHEGEWDVLRIIVEHVDDPDNHKDVLVTLDHILPYAKNKEDWDEKKVSEKKAKKFEIGDYVWGFIEGSYNWTTETVIPPHMEPFRVSNITEMVVDGVADIQTNCKWFMGHYMLAVKVPWTGYVDWLPVRVTYETVSEYTITFYYYDGGYILVNGTAKTNGSSTVYDNGEILNLTGVKNKTGWSLFWMHKNFTWTDSNTTDNSYMFTVSENDTIHNYFQPNIPANVAAVFIIAVVGVPIILIFWRKRD